MYPEADNVLNQLNVVALNMPNDLGIEARTETVKKEQQTYSSFAAKSCALSFGMLQ